MFVDWFGAGPSFALVLGSFALLCLCGQCLLPLVGCFFLVLICFYLSGLFPWSWLVWLCFFVLCLLFSVALWFCCDCALLVFICVLLLLAFWVWVSNFVLVFVFLLVVCFVLVCFIVVGFCVLYFCAGIWCVVGDYFDLYCYLVQFSGLSDFLGVLWFLLIGCF